MIRHDCEQGSMEWYRIKLGVPSASNFHKIITPGGKASTQAAAYMYRLIAEKLLLESMDSDINTEWVQRGREQEPYAAAQFEFAENVELERVGFVTDDKRRLGCSPDRLIKGRNESLEVKCPSPWVQIGYLLDGPGTDYKPQVQGQLMIGEFDSVHFYAFHPRMPAFHRITHRDQTFMKTMVPLLDQFLETLQRET